MPTDSSPIPPVTSFWKNEPLEVASTGINPLQLAMETQAERLQFQQNDPEFLAYINSLEPAIQKIAIQNLGGSKQDQSPILTVRDLVEKVEHVVEYLTSRGIPISSEAPLTLRELTPKPKKQANAVAIAQAQLEWKEAVARKKQLMDECDAEIRKLHDAYKKARGVQPLRSY